MRRALIILATSLAALGAAAPAVAAPPGLTAEDGFLGPAGPARPSMDRAAARDYWTPARIAAAGPLDLGAETPPRPAPERLFAAPQTLKASILTNPGAYPNRVHGKLVGTFPGLGDYSCSATVVSSGTGGLLTTAGHCAYDVDSGTVAVNIAFAPGYSKSSLPYGVWPITHLIVDKRWGRGSLDFDYSMMQVDPDPADGTLQSVVGSRGIGFNQPRKQRLQAYGYPAKGNKEYNGDRLVRCESGYLPDPYRSGGPRGRGMRCNQKEGSSGGGWVSKHKYVVSNTSHGYPRISSNLFFGPYYGAATKRMYKAKTSFWPSIKPPKRKGGVPNLIGPKRGQK